MPHVVHHYGRTNKHDWPIDKIRHWIEIEGKTHRWVGEQIGCRDQHVSRICRKNGIKVQRTGPRSGCGHPEWKGGRLRAKTGYIRVYSPGHPYATKPRKKYVFEHRLVMEKHIGRYLLPGEIVHHKNGVHDDNRIENLVLYSENKEHLRHELAGKVPKWTEDGKQRIQAGVKKAVEIRQALRRNASRKQ